MRALAVLLSAGLVVLAAGCGTEPAAVSQGMDGQAAVPAATAPAAAQDETSLRASAGRALTEQRLYAPAGDNAIEYYLALRSRAPGDADVETALLELLPYAQIAAEQATARGDWDEARRLIRLIASTDARLPAITRLRDRLAVAQAEAEQLAAVRERELAEAQARAAAEQTPATALAAQGGVSAPTAVDRSPGALAQALPPPSAEPAPAPVATAAPAPAPSNVPETPESAGPRLPQLLQAPQPRYPLMALRRKLEGEVLLELRITADGRVAEARVVTATPPGLFDQAAVSAAERWRFAPGPEAVTTRQVMRFRLPDATAGARS